MYDRSPNVCRFSLILKVHVGFTGSDKWEEKKLSEKCEFSACTRRTGRENRGTDRHALT
jgi:hypothetical protein